MKAQSVGGGWSGLVTGYPLVINNPSSSLAQDSRVRTQRVATSAARFPWPAVETSQYVMNHDELLINKLLIRL